MDSGRKRIIIIRGAITAVLFLAGFAFPLIWIAAAFFAYTTFQAFPDPEPDTPENIYRPRQSSITADDPDWRERFLLACESPAETAFLEAMIDGYGLEPDNGILVGSGIELDMQTEYKPYRLDFLINKWLVVEIDGAAWHSSQEAVNRDGVRDDFFSAKGFSVLRIPAKTVFNTPTKAVELVRTAIARGRPPQKVVVHSPPISVAKTFMNSMNSVGKFLDHVDAHATKASAIQQALAPVKQTVETEMMIIETALEAAKRKVDIEVKLAASPDVRKLYDAAYADTEKIIQSGGSSQRERKTRIKIDPLSRPPTHADPEINREILESYLRVVADRKRCFDDAKNKLSKDPRLSPHVRSHLERLGCHATWKEISAKDDALEMLDAFVAAAHKRKPPPSS